jgi:hypothetical protein
LCDLQRKNIRGNIEELLVGERLLVIRKKGWKTHEEICK